MKEIMNGLDRFNRRYAKNAADRAATTDKQIEEKIADEMRRKKDLYDVVTVLSRSVTMLAEEIMQVRTENAELKEILEDVRRNQKVEFKSEFDVITEHYLSLHRRGELVSRNEMIELGLDCFMSPFHKFRMDQIRERGFWVDPVNMDDWTILGLPAPAGYEPEEGAVTRVKNPLEGEVTRVVEQNVIEEEVTVGEQWTIPPKNEPIFDVEWKRGPRPQRVVEALDYVNKHRKGKQFDWVSNPKELIYAFLTIAQYEGMNIESTYAMQRSKYKKVCVQINKKFGSQKEFIVEFLQAVKG